MSTLGSEDHTNHSEKPSTSTNGERRIIRFSGKVYKRKKFFKPTPLRGQARISVAPFTTVVVAKRVNNSDGSVTYEKMSVNIPIFLKYV